MTGLWSAQRRNRLNLNSVVVVPSPSPSSTPANEDVPAPEQVEQEQPAPVAEEARNDPLPAGTATKRKVRSSRTTEGTSKRTKLSSSASGPPGKDHSPPTARLSDLGGVEAC